MRQIGGKKVRKWWENYRKLKEMAGKCKMARKWDKLARKIRENGS